MIPIPIAPLDRVVRAVWRTLKDDAVLGGMFAGAIWRYGTYTPSKLYGRPNRLVVAPLQLTSTGVFSRAWTGDFSVAVVHEYVSSGSNLHVPEPEATELTLLSYIRDLLARVGPNLRDDPTDPATRLRCIRNAPRFETLALTPQGVEGGDDIAFFVALVAVYKTIEDAP